MKKLIYLSLVLFLFIYCGPKQEKVERYMKDGVEVVVNHLEPYKIKGEPSTLHLEEEFRIDTESDELAKLGLLEVFGFDVDSEGNIYIFQSTLLNENLVVKLDRNGNFVKSFLRRGQGPGEVQYTTYGKINSKDEIPIVDSHGHKLLIFSKDGKLIKETRLHSKFSGRGRVVPLENGNYLIEWPEVVPSEDYAVIHLTLFDSEFKKIKELDRYESDGVVPTRTRRVRRPTHIFRWNVTKNRIYIGNEDRGYEFWVYDFDGNLRRKIKKQYKPVIFSESYKESLMKDLEAYPELRKNIHFPKYWPPFQFSFTDDKGRLFVMTSEKGENQKEYVFDFDHPMEYVYDIFNSDGIFIGRKSLRVYFAGIRYWVTMKKNRFYCLRNKESGYKELVVYKMRWD